jgi:hypothetical protein
MTVARKDAIWQDCQGERHVQPMQCRAWRVVESQEVIATLTLVDTLEEQDLLEQLLETTKPSRPQPERHYLLTTPFRYPPLKHGSRFGKRHEPSLFYAATSVSTALAETAYYRLVFLQGMTQPFANALNTEHTVFYVNVQCQRGIVLQAAPFDAYRSVLMAPADYAATQTLGVAMRVAGVEGFQYRSARDAADGINVALFVPEVIRSNAPQSATRWLCQTDISGVVFRSADEREPLKHFARPQFLFDGNLPSPAL